MDPFERQWGDVNRQYAEHKAWVLTPIVGIVEQHLATFREFPVRQVGLSAQMGKTLEGIQSQILKMQQVEPVAFASTLRWVGGRVDQGFIAMFIVRETGNEVETRRSVRCPRSVVGRVPLANSKRQEILPFPPAPSGSTPGLTMQDSTYKKRVEPKRLADGAPNILIILMDDVGPATPSTYGGEINTPTLDRVAKMGISYNRFHSTAMCSPTRAALLTGRNHTRRRQRPDRGACQRLRRLQRHHSEIVGDRRRGAEELRLQYRRVGQVAQHAGGADHLQGAVRLLADRLRLRILLRLPRRRGLAI